MLRHAAIASWYLICGIAFAQQETPQHSLRVLALGDPPPFVQQVRDGVRYEVPPPPELIPPRSVTIPVEVKPGSQEQPADLQMRLRLGQASTPLMMPMPESRRVRLKSDTGAVWAEIPLVSNGATLALICRGGPSWAKGATLAVPDDAIARAEGNLHFTNMAPFAVGIAFGKEKIRLEPGITFTRKAENGSRIPLEISYFTSSGGSRMFYSSMVEGGRGTFSRFLMYKADGKAPRNPIKVLQLDEAAAQAPAAVTAR